MIEGLKTAGLNPSPSSLLQTITMIDLMSALVSDIQTVSGQTPTAFTSISVDSGSVSDLAISVGANGNGFYEESSTLLSVAIANTKVAAFTTTGISTGTVDATTVNATTGGITTVNATTVNATTVNGDTVNTTAGLVSALAVNIGTNGNGFYEESSVQLGVAIGNTEVASFNANGLATDGLLERVADVGVPFKLGSSGSLAIKAKEASVTCSGGATETIPVQVPDGSVLLAVQTRNDSLIVLGGGGVTYSVTIITVGVATGVALTKNTKTNTMWNTNSNLALVSGGAADITLTPDAGTMDSGTITAIVYYMSLTPMADHA